MLKRNYYYLIAGFPEVLIDQKKLPFSLVELKQELKYHLHPKDYKLVEYLFLPYDNINLLNLLQKNEAPFDSRGNFSQSFLEDELKEPEKLPEYMRKFLQAYREEVPLFPKLSLENQLTWLYFDFMIGQENRFLRDIFSTIRNIKNIFAVFNSRDYGLDIESQMIGEYELTEAAKKTTSKDFGLANELSHIDEIIGIYENNNILEQEISIDLLKWKYMNNLNTFNYFTIEKILAYVLEIMMVERWMKLDPEQSSQVFKKILSDLENSIQFSKDFNINEKRR